ncbi:MAG: manganese efflux pump [Eubacterium sp.]|nr:manganese efflux pump [Eubacterium sp.]
MRFIELVLLAVGLAMDAFAVSICKGLAMRKPVARPAAVIGLWFGGFQALMPLLGFLLGSSFLFLIQSIDHWVAFGLLALIGCNMLREAGKEDGDGQNADTGFVTMLLLAVATSIDAFAVGITFAALQVNIIAAVLLIGGITFVISAAGVFIGYAYGSRYRKSAEIAGGIILIIIGLKILLEHLLT